MPAATGVTRNTTEAFTLKSCLQGLQIGQQNNLNAIFKTFSSMSSLEIPLPAGC